MTKDFNDMTGPELVQAYNAMASSVGAKEINRFESLVTGIHRCQALQRQIDSLRNSDIPKELRRYDPPKGAVDVGLSREAQIDAEIDRRADESSADVEADKRWRNWQPKPGLMTRPRKSFFRQQVLKERAAATQALTATQPSLPNASKSRRADRVIRILVDANPRRAGSEAHRHFEAMRGGITVGEYLAKFENGDRKKAAQWLWNTVDDGFVKLLG